ncbi:hypothetical protein [Bradyrhizobium sp. 18BD]
MVTPSYNHAQYLGTTIESIVTQNYPNLYYHVQDGASIRDPAILNGNARRDSADRSGSDHQRLITRSFHRTAYFARLPLRRTRHTTA